MDLMTDGLDILDMDDGLPPVGAVNLDIAKDSVLIQGAEHWIFDEFSADRPSGLDFDQAKGVVRSVVARVFSPSLLLRFYEGLVALHSIEELVEILRKEKKNDYKIVKLMDRVQGQGGYDLVDVVREYGGKNLGDLLLEVFYAENKLEVESLCSEGGFSEIVPNHAMYVDTMLSKQLEALLPDLVFKLDEYIQQDPSKRVPQNYFTLPSKFVRRYVLETLLSRPEITNLLQGLWDKFQTEFSSSDQINFRLRGSQIYEDWLDTGLAGVSQGGSYLFLNMGEEQYRNMLIYSYGCDANAVNHLEIESVQKTEFMIMVLSLYSKFLFHKGIARLDLKDEVSEDEVRLGSYSYIDYSEDEALGMQIVPTIDFEHHVVAVVEETDEGEELVRMDVKLNQPGMEGYVIRVEVFENHEINIVYGFDLDKAMKVEGGAFLKRLVSIGKNKCFISELQILAIANLMSCKKAYFGFACDSEFGLCGDGKIVDFQTRLAPTTLGISESVHTYDYNEIGYSDFVLSQRFLVNKKLLKVEHLYSLVNNNFEQLIEAIGDPGEYILLLDDQPISRYISFLIRLATEKDMYFAGIIDVESGIDLTHSNILNGGTYFLRHNVPVVGRPNDASIFDSIYFEEAGKVGEDILRLSSAKVLIFSPDGRRASIAVEKIAA